jgi:hypothetical protein
MIQVISRRTGRQNYEFMLELLKGYVEQDGFLALMGRFIGVLKRFLNVVRKGAASCVPMLSLTTSQLSLQDVSTLKGGPKAECGGMLRNGVFCDHPTLASNC